MLPVYEAISVLQHTWLRGGSTNPILVNVNVDGQLVPFVVKIFKTDTLKQYNAVAHEVFCNVLLEEFGLLKPDAALIEFGTAFLSASPPWLHKLLTNRDSRIKFGTRYIQSTTTYSQALPYQFLKRYDLETIYAFDCMVFNSDRKVNKPNILFSGADAYMIDHEYTLELSSARITALQKGQLIYPYKHHIFYPALKQRQGKPVSDFATFGYDLYNLNTETLRPFANQLETFGLRVENFEVIMRISSQFKGPFFAICRNHQKHLGMITEFKYSLLYYVHSEILSERLVVGVLFYFPANRRFVLSYPKSLKRIKSLYRDLQESQLVPYLAAIEKRANTLSDELDFHSSHTDFDKLIDAELLVADSTSLQFSPSFLVHEPRNISTDEIIQQYTLLYLEHYALAQVAHPKHDESYISKRIRTLLVSKNKEVEKYIHPGYPVVSSDRKAELKIDFWWQNQVAHLVKPLGFDLIDASTIKDKAILCQGQLNYLGSQALRNNQHFDLLIVAPQSPNNEILDAYHKALEIIRDADAPYAIIEENALDFYSDQAVHEILSHPLNK